MTKYARFSYALMALCIALPWINPFASGPSNSASIWHTAGVSALGIYFLLAFNIKITRGCCDSHNLSKVIAWGVFFAAALNAAMGIIQWLGYELYFYPLINYSEYGLPIGNTRQRNLFGVLNAMGLISAIFLHEVSLRQAFVALRINSNQVILWSFALAPMGLVAGLALSRTGLLIVMLTFCLMAINYRRVMNGTITLLAAYAIGILASISLTLFPSDWFNSPLLNWSQRLGDLSGSSRDILYRNILELIGQNFWFGVGWNQLAGAHFSMDYEAVGIRKFPGLLDHAHNLPLHFAVTLGVPFACLAFVLMLIFLVWLYRNNDENPDRAYLFGIIAAVLLHSMLEYPLWIGGPALLTTCCLLVLLYAVTNPKIIEFSAKFPTSYRVGHGVFLAVFLGSIVLLYSVIRDYQRLTTWESLSKEAEKVGTRQPLAPDVFWYRDRVSYQRFLAMVPQTSQSLDYLTLGMQVRQWSPHEPVIERIIAVTLGTEMNVWAISELKRYQASFPKAGGDLLKRVETIDPSLLKK